MTIRVIRNDQDAERLATFLKSQKCVLTVKIEKGERRTSPQNRLLSLWINDIASQTKETADNVRAMLKLMYGVPILRATDEAFQAAYDKSVKCLSYEQKIITMKEPIDFPVTRLMTTEQFNQMLNTIDQEFSEKGFILTYPDDLKWKAQ